jgi:hypothetical protein
MGNDSEEIVYYVELGFYILFYLKIATRINYNLHC